MNSRERFFSMLEGKPVDRLLLMPITMMFAAKRIDAKYFDYVTNHHVLVDAQIATATAFDLDYVSCISDPTREAADCGAAIKFYDNQPPAIDETNALLADKRKLGQLKAPSPYKEGRMHDRVRAAAEFKNRVGEDKIIEGWIEGPCAEAADLRGISALMLDFIDDPQFVLDLFEFVLELELSFARAQAEAGVDLMGIGDAAASLVGPALYEDFVLPYQKRMVNALHEMGLKVRLHICGNTSRILKGMGSLGCEIVDIDLASMADGREAMGPDQILLGNINPVKVLLDGTPEIVTDAISRCHEQTAPRFIVGAGCEVPRDTPDENMYALRDYAQSHTPALNR
ncbi:MAG: uroporphyrinogen decarboxylase family protein [Verrucomicrobia bacterium]|nr:uroporphyrinogen decarboxylase family protein [Verrucomicrobiota bacterium]